MPDRIFNAAGQNVDNALWITIFLMAIGTFGRTLLDTEPFKPKRFVGEVILSALGGVVLYSFGIIKGLSTPEIILLGALGGMGGVRMIEWIIKIAKAVQRR